MYCIFLEYVIYIFERFLNALVTVFEIKNAF